MIFREGERSDFIFGSYQNGGVQDVQSYQGNLSSYLFTLNPEIHYYTTDRGDGDSKYFWFNTISNDRFGKRKGLGFGGNEDKKNFKLWIDEDLDHSTVYNGKDNTYGFGHLATFNTDKLHIKRLEFWGLGHQFDLDNHKKYWDEREIEIMKRRKVDKKELLGQNADLFFGIYMFIKKKRLSIEDKFMERSKSQRKKKRRVRNDFRSIYKAI